MRQPEPPNVRTVNRLKNSKAFHDIWSNREKLPPDDCRASEIQVSGPAVAPKEILGSTIPAGLTQVLSKTQDTRHIGCHLPRSSTGFLGPIARRLRNGIAGRTGKSRRLAATACALANAAYNDAALGRHPHRREHRHAGFGASRAGLGADRAMLMHLAVAAALLRAGAAERDAVRQLGFEQLPMSGLVRSRRMLPVALHTAAQSRLSRMHATSRVTSRSDRQASAQAVQVSTQLKHASMQRLMASECAGFSG